MLCNVENPPTDFVSSSIYKTYGGPQESLFIVLMLQALKTDLLLNPDTFLHTIFGE